MRLGAVDPAQIDANLQQDRSPASEFSSNLSYARYRVGDDRRITQLQIVEGGEHRARRRPLIFHRDADHPQLVEPHRNFASFIL